MKLNETSSDCEVRLGGLRGDTSRIRPRRGLDDQLDARKGGAFRIDAYPNRSTFGHDAERAGRQVMENLQDPLTVARKTLRRHVGPELEQDRYTLRRGLGHELLNGGSHDGLDVVWTDLEREIVHLELCQIRETHDQLSHSLRGTPNGVDDPQSGRVVRRH